jgi:hypothetical protein
VTLIIVNPVVLQNVGVSFQHFHVCEPFVNAADVRRKHVQEARIFLPVHFLAQFHVGNVENLTALELIEEGHVRMKERKGDKRECRLLFFVCVFVVRKPEQSIFCTQKYI